MQMLKIVFNKRFRKLSQKKPSISAVILILAIVVWCFNKFFENRDHERYDPPIFHKYNGDFGSSPYEDFINSR